MKRPCIDCTLCSFVNQYGKQQVTTVGLATKKTKRIELSWTRPPEGVLKVNFDGAYNYRTQKAALGVIIRNNMGEPVLTAWGVLFGCRDAEEAETWACLDGIRLTGRWSDMSLILESDCSLLVEKINKKAMDRSVTAGLIQEIKQEFSTWRSPKVLKIGRDQNSTAHELAQHAVRSGSSQVSFSFIPSCIQEIILKEKGLEPTL
jgi:ribonuclease HI